MPEAMKSAMNSLNGHALSIAALLGASTRCVTQTIHICHRAGHCSTLWCCHAPSRLQHIAASFLTAQPPCRLPLGVPSQLVLTAMDLAGRLIGVPQSKAAAAQVPMRLLQSSN